MLTFVSLMGAAYEAWAPPGFGCKYSADIQFGSCCFVLVGVYLSNLALTIIDRRISEVTVSHLRLSKTGAPSLPGPVRSRPLHIKNHVFSTQSGLV